MLRLAFVWIFCFLCVAAIDPSVAQPIHGGIANGSIPAACPQGSALPDGCASAPAGAVFVNASFFTTAPASGQGPYATRAPWNVAGVDYNIGPTIAIGSAANPNTINSTNHPTCSWTLEAGGNGWINCNPNIVTVTGNVSGTAFTVTAGTTTNIKTDGSQVISFACPGCSHPHITGGSAPNYTLDAGPTQNGSPVTYTGASIEVDVPVDIEGYNIADDFLWVESSNAPVTLKNNYLHWGNVNCRDPSGLSNGTGMVRIDSSDLTETSDYYYFDTSCSFYANLYKATADPGLTTQATFTGSIASGVMSISANSGHIQQWQYINYSGQVNAYQILSLSSGTACDGSACNSITANIGLGPCGAFATSACATDGTLTVGSGTMTTGPVESTLSADIAGGLNISSQYNVTTTGANHVTNSGYGNIDDDYSYAQLGAKWNTHYGNMEIEPLPPVSTTRDHFIHQYGLIWTPAYGPYGTGTANAAIFTTNGGANTASGGVQVTTTTVTIDHIVLVSNKSGNGTSGGVTPFPLAGSTAQTTVNSLAQTLNQIGTASATGTGSITTTTLTISACSVCTFGVGQWIQTSTGQVQITALGTGTGGIGTYTISPGATASSGTINSYPFPGIIGTLTFDHIYGDAHGANSCWSGDFGTRITTTNDTNGVNLITGSAMTNASCSH